jgi:hypothetical protein
VLSQFAVNGGNGPYDECIAISTTSNPTGTYYVYDFHLSDTVFHDYPKLGVWPDAYYMTTNQFAGAAQTFVGAGAFAFDAGKVVTAVLRGAPSGASRSPAPSAACCHLTDVRCHRQCAELFCRGGFHSELAHPRARCHAPLEVSCGWLNTANSTFGLMVSPARPSCRLLNPSRVSNLRARVHKWAVTQLDVIGDRIMFRLAYRNLAITKRPD